MPFVFCTEYLNNFLSVKSVDSVNLDVYVDRVNDVNGVIA